MSHRLGCTDILKIVDECFLVMCGASQHPKTNRRPSTTTFLTPANVAAFYAHATRLQMRGLPCCTVTTA